MTTATDPPRVTSDGAPPSASAREYLRGALPAVYRERSPGAFGDAFAMRFVEGLEEVLDPIVSMLDLLAAHLDLDLAPPEIVSLIGEWLGLEFGYALTSAGQRRLVREGTSITRARGTRACLERVLRLAFEDVALEIRDGGRVTWSTDATVPAPAGEPAFEVLCPASATAAQRAAIRRVVGELKPAHVGFELVEVEERTG
jgi:phage tail-like protein